MEAEQRDEESEKKRLNLTVGITYQGLYIAGAGGELGQVDAKSEESGKSGPTIPLVTTNPACREALAKAAHPPASCCYDYARLTSEMVKIKRQYPKETKIIIDAQQDVPYEVLVKVIDTTRESEGRKLFNDVIFGLEIFR